MPNQDAQELARLAGLDPFAIVASTATAHCPECGPRPGMHWPKDCPHKNAHVARVAAAKLLHDAASRTLVEAVQNLEELRAIRIREGVVVSLETWNKLQGALAGWRIANEVLLAAMRSST